MQLFNGLRRITRLLRMVSAFVIVAVMLITGYDVVMRYVFAQPLDWSITISMVGLVTIVMLTVADLEAEDGHIGMDLFYRGFGRTRTVLADFITFFATFVFCIVSGIAAALTSIHFFQAGMRTAGTFNMPIWIGYAFVALGLILTAVMTLLRYILTRQGKLVASSDDPASDTADHVTEAEGTTAGPAGATAGPAGPSAAGSPTDNPVKGGGDA